MVAVGLESEVAENLSILKNQAKRRTEWTLEKNEIQDTLIPLFQGLIDFLCYNVKLGLFALQGSLYLKLRLAIIAQENRLSIKIIECIPVTMICPTTGYKLQE